MKIQFIFSKSKRIIILLLLFFTLLVGSATSISLAVQQTSSMEIAENSKAVSDLEESKATEPTQEKVQVQKELS